MFQTVVVEKIKTHTLRSVTFFFFENRAVYEIMWNSIVEWGRPQIAVWRMRIACWTPKATNTQTHTHTHRLCNTHCFLSATMVARICLNVTFYVHCLSRLYSSKML